MFLLLQEISIRITPHTSAKDAWTIFSEVSTEKEQNAIARSGPRSIDKRFKSAFR